MTNEDDLVTQKLFAELDFYRERLEWTQRIVSQLERDNRILAENVRRFSVAGEEAKTLQYLYNKLVLENCPNMIMFFDEKLGFVIGTRTCVSELGYREQADIGNLPLREVFARKIAANWIGNIEKQCENVLRTRLTYRDNGVIPYIDGTFSYAQLSVSPVMDDRGFCRGVLLIINDITELTLTKEKAEAAALSKSSFLANMSHEIRTPMNAVKGLAELLLRTSLNGLQKDYVRNILKSADMLLSIINDILDFSKIDANKMDIISNPYKLADFLEDIVMLVNLRAKEKGLTLFVDIDPALPSVLKGDEIRLKQIALNILSNAVKYTEKGWCRLSVKGEWEDGKIKMVFLVADTGIGIKEDELPDIFEAFFRSDLHTTRGIMGTGLGLAIARRLLKAMGGDIAVKSVYGKGTTFTFQLVQEIADPSPLADIEANTGKYALVLDDGLRGEQLEDIVRLLGVKTAYCNNAEDIGVFSAERFTHCLYSEQFSGEPLAKIKSVSPGCAFVAIKDLRISFSSAENNNEAVIYEPLMLTKIRALFNKGFLDDAPAAASADDIKFTGAKALLVDDNDINLMVGGEMLRSYGISAAEAESGQKAIDFCREMKFDIIFMDHMMPAMDGIEAASKIRGMENGLNAGTPMVMFTANVVSGVADEYRARGLQDFVGKPVEMKELYRVLVKWLPPEKQHGYANEDRTEDRPAAQASFDLLEVLDDFGIRATDAVRELGGDLPEYIARLETIVSILADVPKQLKALVAAGDRINFAEQAEQVQKLLYQVGARDFAGRAKSLAVAAREGNTAYINMDFNNFLDNLHLLEKKLEVLTPLAKGKSRETSLLNNSSYIRLCIAKVQKALRAKKTYEALANVEILLGVSLDKQLDAQFIQIIKNIEAHDYGGGIKLCESLLQNY